MATPPSFDITSGVDIQEVDNAVNQAQKEIAQRYDFKGSKAAIEFKRAENLLELVADDDFRMRALFDVVQTKLIKRGVSLKAIDAGEPRASGKEYRIEASLKEGLSQENAKKISKIIREQGPKAVKAQITGDELRVSSKSRDDLQAVIALLKDADLDVALQFVNYR